MKLLVFAIGYVAFFLMVIAGERSRLRSGPGRKHA